MIRINKLEFFNSPKRNYRLVLDLSEDKQFYILTGYNGAGKSRIIKIIHEAFAITRGGKFSSSISRWAFQASLSDEVKIRALKWEMGSASKKDVNDLMQRFFESELELEEVFAEAEKLGSSSAKTRFSGDSNKDVEDFFCGSGATLPDLLAKEISPEDYSKKINLVSYIDETLFFSFPRKVVDSVFAGQGDASSLDKTLWALIHAYVSKVAGADEIKKLISDLVDVQQAKNKKGLTEKEVSVILDSAISELKGNAKFDDNVVFHELNEFYGKTKRKLVWVNEAIHMDVPDEGIIHWTEFSKGEKTLLALMLTVYLYKDTAFFMFDEPDLSLHVEWQRMLLPAFQRLAPNSQFIIGTHSPFLVMNTSSEEIVNLAKKYKEVGV